MSGEKRSYSEEEVEEIAKNAVAGVLERVAGNITHHLDKPTEFYFHRDKPFLKIKDTALICFSAPNGWLNPPYISVA